MYMYMYTHVYVYMYMYNYSTYMYMYTAYMYIVQDLATIFVGSWPPFITSLTYDHPHPSSSQQFAYKSTLYMYM